MDKSDKIATRTVSTSLSRSRPNGKFTSLSTTMRTQHWSRGTRHEAWREATAIGLMTKSSPPCVPPRASRLRAATPTQKTASHPGDAARCLQVVEVTSGLAARGPNGTRLSKPFRAVLRSPDKKGLAYTARVDANLVQTLTLDSRISLR